MGDLIGASVDAELDATLWRLVNGEIAIHDLTPALAAWWHVAHYFGEQSCQKEIRRLNRQLDRQYVAMWNPVKVDPNRPTYAELERRRGNPEHAAQIEADLAILLLQVAE
jgi:hypothetical protein